MRVGAVTSGFCPACSASISYHLMDWEFSGLGDSIFNYTANFFSCKNCGLVYVRNIDDQRLAKFYTEECSYFEKSHFSITDSANKEKYIFYSRFLEDHGLKFVDMVDVGCGRGGFVKWLGEGKWGGMCWGVDVDIRSIPLNPVKADCCASFKTGQALNLPFDDESVDLLTYLHVLEHIRDLNGLLEEASRVLKCNGHILIEVPDAENYWSQPIGTAFWISIREHIYHFTAAALVMALQSHGFQVVRISRQNLPTPEFFYPSLMLLGRKSEQFDGLVLPRFGDVASFVLASRQALVQQASKIAFLSKGNKIAFWGCSAELFSLLPLIDRCDIRICDSSKLKQATNYKSIAIEEPSDLPVEGMLVIAPYLHSATIQSAACRLGWPESAIHLLR